MTDSEAGLVERLREVEDPLLGSDIVTLGLVNSVNIDEDEGVARVSLALNTPFAPTEMRVGERIREVVSDAGYEPELSARVGEEHGFDEEVLPNVRNVIAVASGKGGVGKTTVAANLAAGLANFGARVGLLDADIHGPNVPRLLPTDQQPGAAAETERLVPPVAHGVKIMSMGYLIREPDDPAIMRGPMVHKVMTHFLENVEWGQLDYLIVDLPPGTGDASLNLLQSMPVTGVVIVTTPQRMAIDDARKGLRLFEKHDTPVIGIVENMSAFHCPSCGDHHELFGHGGAQEICDDYGVELLAQLPIHEEYGAEHAPKPVAIDNTSHVHDTTVALIETIADEIGRINRQHVADNHPTTDHPITTD